MKFFSTLLILSALVLTLTGCNEVKQRELNKIASTTDQVVSQVVSTSNTNIASSSSSSFDTIVVSSNNNGNQSTSSNDSIVRVDTNTNITNIPEPSNNETNSNTNNTANNVNTCIGDTWICSDWNACSANNIQTRTCSISNDCPNVNTPSPSLSQNCIFTPINSNNNANNNSNSNLNSCFNDTWICSDWGSCQPNSSQSRTCYISLDCPEVNTPSPSVSQSCSFDAPTCTSWSYSSWSSCSSDGKKTRSITASYPENCKNGNPIVDENCENTIFTYNKYFPNYNHITIEFSFNNDHNIGLKYVPTITDIEPFGNVNLMGCGQSKTLPGYGSNLLPGDDGYIVPDPTADSSTPRQKAEPTKIFNFNLKDGWDITSCKKLDIIVSNVGVSIDTDIGGWVLWDYTENSKVNNIVKKD